MRAHLIHSACIHGALPKSQDLGREGKREMSHSLHPGGADGKERKANRSAWSCRNRERRAMGYAARSGFAGEPSKKISDETEHPWEKGSGEGAALGREPGWSRGSAGQGSRGQGGATDGVSAMEWQGEAQV